MRPQIVLFKAELCHLDVTRAKELNPVMKLRRDQDFSLDNICPIIYRIWDAHDERWKLHVSMERIL